MTTEKDIDWIWDVGKIPFIYTPLKSPTNGNGLPDFLPFEVNIDRETGMLKQVVKKTVSVALSRAYIKGSMISGMMNDSGIGRQYAEDFLAFLIESFKTNNFKGKRILEIGCGTGYLLYRLKLLGAKVLGVEPGPQGQYGKKKFKIPIIKDYFPSSKINGTFDIIILYGVLEHIKQPDDLIFNLRKYLNRKGIIVISVPNCEPYIKAGDISMFLHEHYSYFTKNTLFNLINKALRCDVSIKKSSFGGCLYAITKNNSLTRSLNRSIIKQEIESALKYKSLAERKIIKLQNYLGRLAIKKGTVGIYVPGRIINVLSLIKDNVDLLKLRFFDDNKLLQGTYFAGFKIPIESRQRLITMPPSEILIMSCSFGKMIHKQLKTILGKKIRIITWQDL